MRDTSKDGPILDRVSDYALSHFAWFWRIVMSVQPLYDWLNRKLINRAVNTGESRPRPFSSMPPRGEKSDTSIAGYTSFDSLMDQRWFSRHLPCKDIPDLPAVDDVCKLFEVGADGPTESKRSTLLFPVFAQWFTDGFLMTDVDDPHRRKTFTRHQIDVNPLYGLDREQTTALRLCSEKSGEKGLLKFETLNGETYAPRLFDDKGEVRKEFSALRLPVGLMGYLQQLPADVARQTKRGIFAFGGERANSTPYTAAINTLFLREHNRIAHELESNNPEWDDERVFQTARNIVMVLLIKVVVEEYINHITGRPFKLKADPSACYGAKWNRPNWVPIEFNLLYRWHSLTPEKFDIGGKTLPAKAIVFNNQLLLETGVDKLMEAASAQPAWELGLFNTPNFLLHVEKSSIEQARNNKLASYNDYRKAFGLPRVTRFEQITGDTRRIKALRTLYGDVDRVEFFVGLFAEPVAAPAGLPTLIKRMVAFDAFSLALTHPLLSEHVFNEATFTAWGMQQIGATSSLQDILDRNNASGRKAKISMDLREGAGKSSSPEPVRTQALVEPTAS